MRQNDAVKTWTLVKWIQQWISHKNIVRYWEKQEDIRDNSEKNCLALYTMHGNTKSVYYRVANWSVNETL